MQKTGARPCAELITDKAFDSGMNDMVVEKKGHVHRATGYFLPFFLGVCVGICAKSFAALSLRKIFQTPRRLMQLLLVYFPSMFSPIFGAVAKMGHLARARNGKEMEAHISRVLPLAR